MNLVPSLMIFAPVINGLLAGLNVVTALVKSPARRRIGAVASATFARGSDLGNGLLVYPLLGIGAALLALLATVIVSRAHSPVEVILPLSVASLLSLLHPLRHDEGSTSNAQSQRRTRWRGSSACQTQPICTLACSPSDLAGADVFPPGMGMSRRALLGNGPLVPLICDEKG